MVVPLAVAGAPRRQVWLRRGDPSHPHAHTPGVWRDLMLSAMGNAAARETLVTATSHMAAVWTDLFESIIAPGSALRWHGNGPGFGRDARIAYSSLLGRYLARAYLTEQGGVRVLVPLDVAKRRLQGTAYVIEKDPPGRGLEADWIGLDGDRLVIAEAKGTFDEGRRTWHGPNTRPQILQTAIEQAKRTAVRCGRRKLPAMRWAIASRWGTEDNHCEPTLLAWQRDEGRLPADDYRALERILFSSDLSGVMIGLGHSEALQTLDSAALSGRVPGELWIRVGRHDLDQGFPAIVGPFGVFPLRNRNGVARLGQVRRVRGFNLNMAVVSLSSRYARTVIQDGNWPDELETDDSLHSPFFAQNRRRTDRIVPPDENFAISAGLTVIWPKTSDDIVLAQ